MPSAAIGLTSPSMPEFILDTGIVIRYLRGDWRAAQLLDSLKAQGVVSASIVTALEVLVGCRDDDERDAAHELLARLNPVVIDLAVAEKAALLIQRYPHVFGRQVSRGTADALIAATAWNLNATLYTLNTRQFARIPLSELVIHAIDQTARTWA